jgi:two-component system, NarL family, sensor histidine kinase DegS
MSTRLYAPETREFTDQMAAIAAENRDEIQKTNQSIEEIHLLISQTASEIDRLSQREVQLANRVREMEANMDAFPRTDIRDILQASHEVELRLFMMRGQLEQLQEREDNIREYREKVRLLAEITEAQVRLEQERLQRESSKTSRLRRRETQEFGPVMTPFEDLIQAQEAERGRIASRIVDGPAQTLANIILETEICERLIDRDLDQAKTELQELRAMATRALHQSRRMMYELKPVTLGELGVTGTLRRYLADIQRAEGVTTNVVGPESDAQLNEALRVATYRIMQEIVSAAASVENVTKIDVNIRYEDAQITGRVEINALEIDFASSIQRLNEGEAMRERLQHLEADLQTEITSDQDARITMVIPLG